MAPSAERIVALYGQRKRQRDPRIARMAELLEAYEGNMVIPLPEMDRAEKPLVANLIASGLDQYAMRIASTMPDVWCPPSRIKDDGGDFDIHTRNAQKRRDAIKGWWAMNRLHLMMRKRSRYLIGYATAPVIIRPRPPRLTASQRQRAKLRDIPYWQLRDPLTTLPPPGEELDPPDCIFTFRRTWRWLCDTYPDRARALERPKDCSPDKTFDCIEYADDEVLSLIVTGSSPDRTPWDGANPGAWIAGAHERWNTDGAQPFLELERTENRSGICPVVIPGRIGLGEAQGQFDGLLGLYWWQSKLMALGGLAAERDVFPEVWGIARPGETLEIIVPADGPAGVIGEVQGGEVRATHQPPGQATMLMIDRTERAMRVSGAVPAEFGGESPTNIRTARRGSEVLSSAVDFPIQEAQELLATALQEENVRAIAWAKTFESGPRSFYYSWNGRHARAEYDPTEVFDSDENIVTYSMPGADINDMVIGAGQRIGMNAMSTYRWMEIDPLIEDPEKEMGRINVEGLRRALIQGLQNMAAQGQLPPGDLAAIIRKVEKGKTVEVAVEEVQKEAQRRQAPGVEPVPPDSPEAQPGLAVPGQGAEAGAPIPEQAPSIDNFLDQLRGSGTLQRANL